MIKVISEFKKKVNEKILRMPRLNYIFPGQEVATKTAMKTGTSLVAQWLRLCASTAGGTGSRSLVGALRCCMPSGEPKTK